MSHGLVVFLAFLLVFPRRNIQISEKLFIPATILFTLPSYVAYIKCSTEFKGLLQKIILVCSGDVTCSLKIDYDEFFSNLDVICINYAFLTLLIFSAALAIFFAIKKTWEFDLVKSINEIGKVPMVILVTSIVYLGVSALRVDWGILSICMSVLITLMVYLALILNETLVVRVIFNQWGRLTISRGRDKFLQFVDVKTEDGLFCGLYFDVIMTGPELESMEIKAPIRFSEGDDRGFPYIFPHKGTRVPQ